MTDNTENRQSVAKKVFRIIGYIFVILLIIYTIFVLYQYTVLEHDTTQTINKQQQKISALTIENEAINKQLTAKFGTAVTNSTEAKARVASLMTVPDEDPTVALITDISKLAGQPFFEHAKDGDYVFIYQAAKKAVIYRPSEDKIINTGPVTTN